MSGPELAEWLAFERLYDLPDGYFVAGLLAPMLSSEKRSAADFVPYFKRPARRQPASEQKAIMAAIRAGGRV